MMKMKGWPFMNKYELISALSVRADFSRKDVDKFVNAFIQQIEDSLAGNERVQLVGFGTFNIKSRAARIARNLRSGKEIKIPVSKAPVFTAGKGLREKVNGPEKRKNKI